ncbi:MAG TPA: Holliday junction resolvase RuvX [Pyrinomonadaceae bacterium]|nr:Holliday junction resolvase RuvX [Pyrinomonadaceae bacterium]
MPEEKDIQVPAPSYETSEKGRVLALDWGTKRIGIAVSDELRLTARALPALRRASWKHLLEELSGLLREFDVQRVVFGLPLRLDGTEGDAAREVRRVSENLNLSLRVPVSLQDERMTSLEAEGNLRASGFDETEVSRRRDSESARLILLDYLAQSDSKDAPPSIPEEL